MPTPQTPYVVTGTVYTSRGTVANSLVIINSDISILTDSDGQYILDVANLTDGYVDGNSYTITAQDEFNNDFKTDTITVVSTDGGEEKNLFLDPRDETNIAGRSTGYRVPSEIRNVGNEPVSQDNPLPVENLDREFARKMENTANGQPIYIGEASPGTPTSEARWRIRKMEYGDGQDKPPTGTIWCRGNNDFKHIWDNRGTLSFS